MIPAVASAITIRARPTKQPQIKNKVVEAGEVEALRVPTESGPQNDNFWF